jgi:hypothetical protein
MGVRFWWLAMCLLWLGACTPGDYADGVNSFSTAVNAADTLGKGLQTAGDQARQDQFVSHASGLKAAVSFSGAACAPVVADYHSGDCRLEVNGQPAVASGNAPDMSALVDYAKLLTAVVIDTTCASLKTDGQSLATAVSDMATVAKAPQLAAAAGPISNIAATGACWIVSNKQLRLLRTSTSQADPIVQKLVPLISDADTQNYLTSLQNSASKLNTALISYNRTHAPSDLTAATSLAAAIDQAKRNPPGPTITKLATLHHTLMTDLQSPDVDLKRVSNDASQFIDQVQTIGTSIQALTSASHAAGTSAGKSPGATKPAS